MGERLFQAVWRLFLLVKLRLFDVFQMDHVGVMYEIPLSLSKPSNSRLDSLFDEEAATGRDGLFALFAAYSDCLQMP